MWKIIRAELAYIKGTALVAYPLVLAALIILTATVLPTPEQLQSARDSFLLATMIWWGMLLPHAFTLIALGSGRGGEKRLRLLVPLPIGIRRLGLARVATLLMVQCLTLAMGLIYCLFILLLGGPPPVSEVVYANGVMLFLSALGATAESLGLESTRWSAFRWVTGILLFILMIYGIVLRLPAWLSFGDLVMDLFYTPMGSLLVHLGSLGVLGVSVVLFSSVSSRRFA